MGGVGVLWSWLLRHGHGHGHAHHHGEHGHSHGNHHHEKHESHAEQKHDVSDHGAEFKKKMNDSIVVPHFTVEAVRGFFTEAGFVDVDVKLMKEMSYMEFGGKKLWRRILFAKGRRPGENKSEL